MPVVVSTVESLTDLADAFLTVCETALATTASGIPDPSYVYPTEPVIDCCPSLIVWVSGLSEESTSPLSPAAASGHRAAFGRVNLVGLVVWALRCAPEENKDGSVDLLEIGRAAVEVQEDGWALWNGIYRALIDGTFEGLCNTVHFDRAVPMREQGGCVGWEFRLRAELDGFPAP